MEVTAIDVHVHLCDELTLKAKGPRTQQMAKYFGRERKPVPMEEMAEQYKNRKMMAVIMNTRDETVTGLQPVPNDHVAEYVKKYPDLFLGFGAIDPWTGKLALNEIKRCKEELGLTGIGELNPARQHFFPNDTRFYPLWEQCQKLGMPILFHGGMAAAGAGTPGGEGFWRPAGEIGEGIRFVARDREALGGPRPRRVGRDDLQLGKIRRDVVE